ncbi:MAG TPA: hypothetical protein VN282_05500 [Pyrinomonadaceae bacterium]|nr:hypothetical protein [Pyrinomonadaceae bacterium]
MCKTIIVLSLVLLAGSALGVAAQPPGEGGILIPQGRAQSVPFKGLGGASVGNILVAYIQRKGLDEVAIHGAAPGETWLELVGRDGRRKRLSVRVTPAAQAEARTPDGVIAPQQAAQAAPSAANATRTLSDVAKPSDAVKPAGVAAPAGRAAAPQRAAPPPVEVSRARRSSKSRVEVSVRTELGSDKEVERVWSPEIPKPGKLQEAASEDIGAKLARSAESEPSETITRRSSSRVTTVSVGVDIGERNTLTAEMPFIQREDEVTAGGGSVKTRGQGIGDMLVSFQREQPRLWKTAWDGTAVLSVGLPTGKSVYNVGENEAPLGSGHYEVAAFFGVSRVFDPFVVKAGGGPIYTVPRTVHGTRIAPGLGIMMQTGFSLGLSDRWVLSEEMGFMRRPNVLLSAPTDAGTATADQSYLKHTLTYSPRCGHTFEATFKVGLNSAAADRNVGAGWAYRRCGRDRER